MSSWLDLLPSSERQRIRKRMRSPAAYEKLREKVKGPEDLAEEMGYNEQMAELKFGLETEPVLKDALKSQIENDLKEQGIEAVIEGGDISPDQAQALEAGNFDIGVDTQDEAASDQLMIYPNGNVSEKLPVSKQFSEQYVSSLTSED